MTREGVLTSPVFIIYHSCHPGTPAKTRLDSLESVAESCIVSHPLLPWGPHVTPLQVGPAHIGSPCDPYGVPVWPIARSALLHSHDPNLAPDVTGAKVFPIKLLSEQPNAILGSVCQWKGHLIQNIWSTTKWPKIVSWDKKNCSVLLHNTRQMTTLTLQVLSTAL